MSDQKPRSLPAPLDGRPIFERASSPAGLTIGWQRVRDNAGSAGGDGQTIESFAANAGERIAALSAALRDGSYRPGPLRIAMIDKSSGGKRKLTIPCVRDRIAQSSVAQILMPLLDVEMEEGSFAYRPGRSVADAVKRVELLRHQGFVWTVDADIDDFFDTIPIDALLARFSKSVLPSPLTDLLAIWLEQGAVQGRGIAQGSPLSPLLANLYLDTLDETFSRGGLRIVRYADDFLILTKDRPGAEAGFVRVEKLLAEHGLRLDPQKTRLAAYDDSLRFLGHVFVRGWALADPKGDATDHTTAALARLAEEDHRLAEAEHAAATEEEGLAKAGYDRGLRVLHVKTPGRRLLLRNQSFAVQEAADVEGDAAGRELIAVHHSRIDRIEIGPQVDADLETLRHALACDIPVGFVDGHGRATGHLARTLSQHARRHQAQARHALDPALRLGLARIIVAGRLANQRALLRRINHRRGIDAVANAAALIGRAIDKTKTAASIDALMGFEGAGTRLYWKAWGRLLLGGVTFGKRTRRTGADPVNAALDLASWLLARDIGAIALAAGLHPGFGALHETSDFRDACVFDLMEEFRAGLAESLVLTMINGGGLRGEMFVAQQSGGGRLSRAASDAIVRRYEDRCEQTVTSPRSGKRVTWRRLMREQADAYAAHIEGRATYRPFVIDH
jgi:CRISPR-associated protein Cas1